MDDVREQVDEHHHHREHERHRLHDREVARKIELIISWPIPGSA